MIDGMDPLSFTASSAQAQSTLRKRNVANNGNGAYGSHSNGYRSGEEKKVHLGRKVARKLDIFPKVEQDLTVRTEQGGLISLIGYAVIFIFVLAEVLNHMSMSKDTTEALVVDTSLSPKMQVNINITFPAISCVDLHLDVMDVAGDSQIDIDDTLVKRRLQLNGRPLSSNVIKAEANKKHKEDEELKVALKDELGDNYCGPCYGAKSEDECCNSCDDVVEGYRKKNWNANQILANAEQCIREGRAGAGPKKLSQGEGCNLSGYMNINRVAGNFHFALGEGVERDGRHIHLFLPEDAPKYNTSHIIHELTFGPKVSASDHGSLEGVNKVTNDENGGTGLFQYFIKVVPTTYKDFDGEIIGETNRYFFTERYRPLMTELIGDEHYELAGQDNNNKKAGVYAGGNGKDSQSKNEHHLHKNSILPGIFFVYEIHPFAVVVSPKSVPLSHLLIRIFALIGGMITIVGWIDSVVFARGKSRNW